MNASSQHPDWQIGSLTLRPDVVWSMALSSLRLRIVRSLLTMLTITTATVSRVPIHRQTVIQPMEPMRR